MGKINIILGDITQVKTEAVVNSINTQLIGGAGYGTNGNIIQAGGAIVQSAIQKLRINLGTLEPGKAAITIAGNLPANYIIHTVGPVWKDGENKEEMILTDCYENCLRLAVEKNIKKIAFPNISTGSYKFPKSIAAEISVGTCEWFLRQEEGKKIEEIILVCHNAENYELCNAELAKIKARKQRVVG